MEEAEALALGISALAHIASDDDALARLMAESGIDAATLRARAGEPDVVGAVLDFLFSDERLLLDFCRAESVPPDRVIRARAALPGGGLGDWA